MVGLFSCYWLSFRWVWTCRGSSKHLLKSGCGVIEILVIDLAANADPIIAIVYDPDAGLLAGIEVHIVL